MRSPKPLKIDYNPEKQNIFFTSDLHFGHRNIINFCERPFKSVEEMDETLIKNWNSVVKPEDIIFNLGDFAFAPNYRWQELISRLNGEQYLILGNHDLTRWPGDKTMKLFRKVEQQKILKIEGKTVILNHYPFLCYAGTYYSPERAVYNLHGHVHQNPYNTTGKDNERLSYRFPYQYDVGVDNNNFTPVSWEQIKEIINNQVTNKI